MLLLAACWRRVFIWLCVHRSLTWYKVQLQPRPTTGYNSHTELHELREVGEDHAVAAGRRGGRRWQGGGSCVILQQGRQVWRGGGGSRRQPGAVLGHEE